jgi:hypothetical protein
VVGAHGVCNPVVKTTHTGCFENPETEGTTRLTGCTSGPLAGGAFPSPENVGAEAATGKKCSELASMTLVELESYLGSHKEVKEKDISVPEGGSVYLENQGSGWLFNKDCLKADVPKDGTAVIQILGTTVFTLENSTVEGVHQNTEYIDDGVKGENLSGGDSNLKVTKDVFRSCVECLLGEAEAKESYILANADLPDASQHREDWYANETSVVAKKDTLLNPENNVAIIFLNTNEETKPACKDHMTVEESLVAGAKEQFSMCGKVKSSGAGTSTAVIRGNRFARCLGAEGTSGGDYLCKGANTGKWNQGFDEYGYFPRGGSQSIWGCPTVSEPSYCPSGANFIWSGNVWDNNNASVSLVEAES